MIVAGGRGTRLAPLTDTCPKPLLPLVGVPILQGQITRLAAAGIRRVWLVVGPDTSPFEFLVEELSPHGVAVTLVPEPRPLDTAGGVRAAIGETSGPVVVCNGDVLTDVDLAALVAAHTRGNAAATLSLIRVDDTSSYGVCVRRGTRVVDFVEKPEPGALPDQDTVNAGTYVLAPDALDAFAPGPLSFERDVFPGILARDGHIESVVWDGVWADLGTPSRYRRGHRLVLDGAMPWPGLDALHDRGGGVWLHPDAVVDDAADLRGPLAVLAGAHIGPAVIGPHAVIGDRATVAAGARVRDTVVAATASVGAGVDLDGCILGRGAGIGTGVARLREVVLGDDATIEAGEEIAPGARVTV